MRKVAWPKQPEVKRYSIIVVVTIIVYTGMVGGLRLRVQQAVRMVLFDVSDETMSDEMTTETELTDETRRRRHRPKTSKRPTKPAATMRK